MPALLWRWPDFNLILPSGQDLLKLRGKSAEVTVGISGKTARIAVCLGSLPHASSQLSVPLLENLK
jgi:hypothetical protein